MSLPNDEHHHPPFCQAYSQQGPLLPLAPPPASMLLCMQREPFSATLIHACPARVQAGVWGVRHAGERLPETGCCFFLLARFPHYFVLICLSWYLLYSTKAKCKRRPLISRTAAHCWENNIDVTSSITHFLFHLYANADLSPKLSQRSISLKMQIACCRRLLWLSLSCIIIIISFNLTSTVKHNS